MTDTKAARPKVLVSCLDLREKYLRALGTQEEVLDSFDYLIDAATAVEPERTAFAFDDGIGGESTFRPASLEDLERLIQRLRPQLTLIWRPRQRPGIYRLLQAVDTNSEKWGLAENKIAIVSPWAPLNPRYIWNRCFGSFSLSGSGSTRQTRPKCDFLMANSHVTASAGFQFARPEQVIRVRHMDAVGKHAAQLEPPVGVFLDQMLPFHDEVRAQYPFFSAEDYYARLTEYLDWAKTEYSLDRITIARHPNSTGQELRYLDGWQTSFGETEYQVASATVVFLHHSSALAYAVQLRRQAVCVDLPGILPAGLSEVVQRRARSTGLRCDVFLDSGEALSQSPGFSAKTRQRILRNFYAAGAPSIVEAVRGL